MTDAELLSLAYQRQSEGIEGTLLEIIDQIKIDHAEMQPTPPGPNDVIGRKVDVIAGVSKEYEIMGDGSMVEVSQ